MKDPLVHQQCIDKVVSGMALMGFRSDGTIASPIKGAKEGNTEFLALFRFERPGPLSDETLETLFGRRRDGAAAEDADSSDEEGAALEGEGAGGAGDAAAGRGGEPGPREEPGQGFGSTAAPGPQIRFNGGGAAGKKGSKGGSAAGPKKARTGQSGRGR